ncbi:hypothetical protein AGDE_11829 [Angomonas deanei]|nr:hypothetical protein AGDE_11829 [Angomonas deanei]|eukprot:EPY25378.1 hypothetical protein AGDE_11829 [Angomonas deanei]
MTKSTKDYMSETEAKNLSAGRAPTRNINTTSSKSEQNNTSSDIFQSQRETLSERRAVRELQRQEMSQVAEQQLEAELDRIRDDNTSRWRKSTNFFKRQGKGFLFCYLAMYVGMFSGLYFLFSSGYVRKDAAFEFVTYLFTGMIDKEKLLKRIESYDTYIDFGFAFVINEFLEFVRLPLCFFIMVTLRPLLVRKHVRPSIFRGTAAET